MTFSVDIELQETFRTIKAVVFDVDGVLTDGRLHYSAEGETTKVFHVRDGVAMKLLADQGIKVGVMTAKDSPMVAKRMSDLGVSFYFAGVKDKAACLVEFAAGLGIGTESICFVGDDMVDLPAMALAGASLCPADGYDYVQQKVDMVLPIQGGNGVARFVCDLLLTAKGLYKEAYQSTMSAHFERKR